MGYYNVEHRTDMDGVPGVTQVSVDRFNIPRLPNGTIY